MNRKDIDKIMRKLPQLNVFGIGVNQEDLRKASERATELERDRKELLASVDACNKCCEWLRRNISKIKTIDKRHTSYELKHLAETEIGYMTNGVFICAAIHCGYPYKLTNGPNVRFGMSQKSINQIKARQRGSATMPGR